MWLILIEFNQKSDRKLLTLIKNRSKLDWNCNRRLDCQLNRQFVIGFESTTTIWFEIANRSSVLQKEGGRSFFWTFLISVSNPFNGFYVHPSIHPSINMLFKCQFLPYPLPYNYYLISPQMFNFFTTYF